jgi:hypothetical protein
VVIFLPLKILAMFHHIALTKRKLALLIGTGEINFGGNKPLKIYGTLSCKSGMRMKSGNRVFFKSEEEAIKGGYRPCGHCMKAEYQKWKMETTKMNAQ